MKLNIVESTESLQNSKIRQETLPSQMPIPAFHRDITVGVDAYWGAWCPMRVLRRPYREEGE